MTGELPSTSTGEHPTIIRHVVIVAATLMALLLYLDRFAIGIAGEYIREDMRMTQTQNSWFQSAFFWSYALCMVPAGWFSDRFGARRMLTIYILAWSLFTGLLGLSEAVWQILALRLLFGMAQAGAYPTAGGMIRVWYPISSRGVASSIVALGGRAGGVLAPILTAWLIILFSHGADPRQFDRSAIVNDKAFVAALQTGPDTSTANPINRLLSKFPESIRNEVREAQSSPSDGDRAAATCDRLIPEIAGILKEPDLFSGVNVSNIKLPAEAVELRQRQASGGSFTENDVIRLNRLIVESAFPGSIKRFRGIGWRPTMIAYGLVGIAVALVFVFVLRDSPQQHPWCNDAERRLIDGDSTGIAAAKEPQSPPFPLLPMLTNVGLWGNSLMQLFTNIGWLFVMTTLPRYLEKVHGVSLAGQAVMTAIPTAAGILGMYLGGWWTDLATRFTGRKWGRRLPVLATRFTAGLGYLVCVLLSAFVQPGSSNSWLPWAYVAALCLMAFSVDMGNPAVWGYAQDVGGKYTGSILGWANMWGNLGAAIAPIIYNRVLGEKPDATQWTLMFGVCLLAFVLSGLCSLVMDSTKPLAQT